MYKQIKMYLNIQKYIVAMKSAWQRSHKLAKLYKLCTKVDAVIWCYQRHRKK